MLDAAISNIGVIDSITETVGFGLVAILVSLALYPVIIKILHYFKLWRKDFYDPTMDLESRKDKIGTPIMGGLIVVITIFLVNYMFNWDRKFTWVPIGVMILCALLGSVDDLLSIFGTKRRNRTYHQTLTLVKVHKNIFARIWYALCLPWAGLKNITAVFGSKQGQGVHVHEKLILQFMAGGLSAWWIYWKLASTWQDIYIPFVGFVSVGILIVPFIIFIVMFTANAVNISDGMDGLAGGMLIPTFSALSLLSLAFGYNALATLNATAAGALVTYTFFNIKPARFQMGDVGSLALGGLLAINALAINAMAILPLIAFMFYAEAISVVIQVAGRVIFGKRIFKMAPLHHHFELKGWSEEKTIMHFWVVHLAFVILGIWIGLH